MSEALADNCLRYLRLVGKSKDHAGSHVSQFDRSRTLLSLVHMHLLVQISDKDFHSQAIGHRIFGSI